MQMRSVWCSKCWKPKAPMEFRSIKVDGGSILAEKCLACEQKSKTKSPATRNSGVKTDTSNRLRRIPQ